MTLLFFIIEYAKLDRPAMGPLKLYDRGYLSYMAMLYLDHNMNNPVLVTFCDIIWARIQQNRNKSLRMTKRKSEIESEIIQRRSNNRIRLCLLLIHNPFLIKHRKWWKNEKGTAVSKMEDFGNYNSDHKVELVMEQKIN